MDAFFNYLIKEAGLVSKEDFEKHKTLFISLYPTEASQIPKFLEKREENDIFSEVEKLSKNSSQLTDESQTRFNPDMLHVLKPPENSADTDKTQTSPALNTDPFFQKNETETRFQSQEETRIGFDESMSLVEDPDSTRASEGSVLLSGKKESQHQGGRYEVKETLGEGGMGVVQLVQDRLLEREVALKTIKSDILGLKPLSQKQQILLLRLKREASLTATLEHPNIVPLYDMQKSDGNADGNNELYFTMRKVDGNTLTTILKEKSEDEDLSFQFESKEATPRGGGFRITPVRG